MKKPTKSIITSSLLALAFGAMSVSTTFALFTSQAKTEINVGSGVVNVESSASLARYQSSVDNSNVDLTGSTTYSNELVGNRFSLDGNIVTIDKMVPGDSLTLKLSAINKSNVKTKTRYVVNHSVVGTKTDLYPALKFTFSAGSLSEADLFKWRVNEPVADISTGVALYDDLSVTITFPDGDNGEILFGSENHDNQYQDAACSIAFSLQAVQANAATSPIDEINAYLEVEKMLGHENFTMHDAVKDMREIGYGLENLDVLEGYVYDLANDQFVKEDSVTANKLNYFDVYSSMPTEQTFSIYAVGNGWTTVEGLTVGFDAGDTSGITSITYDRHDASVGQEVIIRTNTAQTTLTINAPLDTIHHYDALGALNIIEAATASYHEFGSIAYAEIAKGRIVLEKGSDVNQIHINKIAEEQAFDTVIIANNGGTAELPEKITRDAVTVEQETLVVKVESNGSSENVYVYAEGQKGTTEKTSTQNEDVESDLGQLVLDNGSNPGEKAQTSEEKTEAKTDAVEEAIVDEILVDTSNITAWIDMPYNKIELEGVGTEENPYLIKNALQLGLVSKNIKNNVSPKESCIAYDSAYYLLMNDIDLIGKEWTPIGSGICPFHGTFDGNNKTIRNVKLDQKNVDLGSWGITDTAANEGSAYGFFGVIGWQSGQHTGEKVTIKNLTLDVSFETNGSAMLGGLVGSDASAHKGGNRNSSLECDIEISNITVNGKVISTNTTGATVGGIVGKLYTKGGITIDNCANNAEVKSEGNGEGKVGGIVGFYSGANNVIITNNTNAGEIVSKNYNNGKQSKAAGICITGSTTKSVNISYNTNAGNVTGTDNAVTAIAFSGNDKPICMVETHITINNRNTGNLFTMNNVTFEVTDVLYTYLVYGGKSQTPADNTTDDANYTGGVVVMEINEYSEE